MEQRWRDLEKIFSKGYECEFFPSDDFISYPRLHLFLGTDYRDRPLILEISLESYGRSKEDISVHLLLRLPFVVRSEMIKEMARFVLLLNRPLDIPGFGFDELSRSLFFRYRLLICGASSLSALLSITKTTHFLVDSLTEQIEKVAEGLTIEQMYAAMVIGLTKAQ